MTVAWITGGGTGIGRALAEALAREGASVALSGRRLDVVEAAAHAVRAATGNQNVVALACDVSSLAAVEAAVVAIEARWGAVTLLINNAGINTSDRIEDAAADAFEKHFQVNCLGAIYTAKRVLPAMRQRGQGTIVNVSSILGLFASADSAAYTVSKFAITGLNEVLHQTFEGTGIQIVGVYPGYIRTGMTDPFVKPGSLKWRLGKTPEQMAAAILRGVRRGRRDIVYPWYVGSMVRLHRWFPRLMDRQARAFRDQSRRARGTEAV
jgi:NAD(P)-dependent dehydrogenase (short-subunit alcohol dehydrogenase family)